MSHGLDWAVASIRSRHAPQVIDQRAPDHPPERIGAAFIRERMIAARKLLLRFLNIRSMNPIEWTPPRLLGEHDTATGGASAMTAVVEELHQGSGGFVPGDVAACAEDVPADLVEQPLPSASPPVPDELSVLVEVREARNAPTLLRRVLDSGPGGHERRALASVIAGAILMMVAGGMALLG
ncbi:MAG: hypothetical protein U5K33_10315 [Halofilum sp. (in: g-proteobacteria)]|nr:hypothetical protein [Halofilum sp. (in: g-proteobacteria)]